MEAIERIVFTETALPADFRGKKRSLPTESQSSEKIGKKIKTSVLNGEEYTSSKDEIRGIMKSIKEFNANATLGSSRRKYQEDLLTQLGAPPPKQLKMPFKLRLKLDEARKKREEKKLEEMRQSDEVTVQHKQLLKKAVDRKEKRKALRKK